MKKFIYKLLGHKLMKKFTCKLQGHKFTLWKHRCHNPITGGLETWKTQKCDRCNFEDDLGG